MSSDWGNFENRIMLLQQNINNLLLAQLDMLHSITETNIDIISSQEPYLDCLHNTRALPRWTTIYPNTHPKDPAKSQTVIMVERTISTDAWEQIPIQNCNPMAITFNINGEKIKRKTTWTKWIGYFCSTSISRMENECYKNLIRSVWLKQLFFWWI